MKKLLFAAWLFLGSCATSVVLGAVEPYDYGPVEGTSTEAEVEALLGFDVVLLGKIELPSLSDGDFEVSGDGKMGTWSSVVPVDIVTVKAAKEMAAYDVGGATSGMWSTLGPDRALGSEQGSGEHDLSNIAFWGRVNPPPGDVVPEPASVIIWCLCGAVYALRKLPRRRR
jgi:hypothetical protein